MHLTNTSSLRNIILPRFYPSKKALWISTVAIKWRAEVSVKNFENMSSKELLSTLNIYIKNTRSQRKEHTWSQRKCG